MLYRSTCIHLRELLKSLASPLPCGIGMYAKYIADETWIETGSRILLNDEAEPALYMQLVEENILEGFGEAGYAVCLPALFAAKQGLFVNSLNEPTIHRTLSELLVGLRQALSQSLLLSQ